MKYKVFDYVTEKELGDFDEIPDSCFEGLNQTYFEIEGETVEWVPAMGPAPIFRTKIKPFPELFKEWKAWIEGTY